MLDQHHHINQSKRRRDRHEEVTGDDRACVIVQKGRPALIAAWTTRRRLGHVLANGMRRNPDGDLEQEFIGDALLAPGRVLPGHASNQWAECQRNGRVAWARLVAPQHAPSGAVPTDYRFRANDDQARAPIAQPGQQGEAHAASMHRGFTPRSLKSRSRRRSARFSASSDRWELSASTATATTSASNRRTIRAMADTPHHATDDRGFVTPTPDAADHRPVQLRMRMRPSLRSW